MGKGSHGGHGGFGGGHGGFHGGHGGWGGHGGFHGGHGGWGGHGGFRRHGPRPGLAFGLGVGMAMRAERRAIRRSYRYGGGGYYGRPVTVVQAPPPPPHVLASAQIPFLREAGNGVTLFHVTVLSVTSLQWEVAARYSSFAALQQRLAYFSRAIRAPFPGKKPLRSFFGGLDEQAKEERRWMLSNWLAEVVALSAANPGVRRELNAFLRTPPELCVPQGPAVANAQEVTNATVVGGPETIQVQMPSGVQPGEMLCIEHHGAQYSIPAPDGVTPGAVFSVTLPEDGPSDGRDTFSSQTVQQAVPVDQSAAAVGGGGGGGVIAVTAIPEPPTATSSKTSGANPF